MSDMNLSTRLRKTAAATSKHAHSPIKNSTLQSLLMNACTDITINLTMSIDYCRLIELLYVNALCFHRIQDKMILKCIPFMKKIRHLFILTDLNYSVIL